MSVLGHCNTFPILSSRWYDRHSHHITCIINIKLVKTHAARVHSSDEMTIHIPLSIPFNIRSDQIRTDPDVVSTSESVVVVLCTSQMRSPQRIYFIVLWAQKERRNDVRWNLLDPSSPVVANHPIKTNTTFPCLSLDSIIILVYSEFWSCQSKSSSTQKTFKNSKQISLSLKKKLRSQINSDQSLLSPCNQQNILWHRLLI